MGFRLTFLQNFMANEEDYVELGLNCAEICRALDRGTNRKGLDELSKSVCDAINQLTTWVEPEVHDWDRSLTTPLDPRTVAEIQGKATEHSGRNRASRFLHASRGKNEITAWKLELDRILQVFNVRWHLFLGCN